MFGSLFTPRHRTAALFPDGMDRHTHILWGVDETNYLKFYLFQVF